MSDAGVLVLGLVGRDEPEDQDGDAEHQHGYAGERSPPAEELAEPRRDRGTEDVGKVGAAVGDGQGFGAGTRVGQPGRYHCGDGPEAAGDESGKEAGREHDGVVVADRDDDLPDREQQQRHGQGGAP